MILATLLAAFTAASLPVSSLPTFQDPSLAGSSVTFMEMAESFLKSVGRKPDASRQMASPEAILTENFLRAPIGLYDVWIPMSSLADKATAKNYVEVCAALCETQAEWVSWLGEGAKDGEALSDSLESYGKWIQKWDLPTLIGAQSSGENNTTNLMGADESVQSTSDNLARAFREASILGEARSKSESVKLVLMPNRKGFVEFIAYCGWYYPNSQDSYWRESVGTWSQFTLNDYQVIALEYASPGAAPGDYEASYSMKTKSPSGMQEQVAQLGLNRLLAYEHGGSLPPSLITGLSINLITKVYGACHTRIDGDTSGKVTQKREVFVRGGQSEGGVLPPNSAESRWRQDYGKKHYAPILQTAQKAGAGATKRKKEKYNSFLLKNDSGSKTYVTHAPLLGPSSGAPEIVPDAVYGDYLEFTRAYQSAFLYWLQHYGAKSKKKCPEAFGQFISRISGSDDLSIAAIAEEIYGKPLSDPEASKKSLEGAFLKWLSKQ
ncbi:MAG: hypothetical protein ACI8X5_003183 [Planctomycetota bacterium]|jgi:hypothetical protein